MKKTRLTSWLAIMLSAALVLLTVGCGGNGSNSGGNTTAAGGTQNTETTQVSAEAQSAEAVQETEEIAGRKLYERTFTASGTDPDSYNQRIAEVINNLFVFYSSTGELDTKLTGYDEPITVTSALSYNAGMEDSMGYLAQAYGESMTYNR